MRLLAILCAALLPLTGCDDAIQADVFDAETEAIVDVVTEARVLSGVGPLEQERTERYYYTVATEQRVQSTEPFEPDEAEVYTIPTDCFILDYDRQTGANSYHLGTIEVYDEAGNLVPCDPAIKGILSRLVETQKLFFEIKVFVSGGAYFPFAEFNANLWDPCRLYYYDQAEDALIELNTWDTEKVVGLRLRNADLLGA